MFTFFCKHVLDSDELNMNDEHKKFMVDSGKKKNSFLCFYFIWFDISEQQHKKKKKAFQLFWEQGRLGTPNADESVPQELQQVM